MRKHQSLHGKHVTIRQGSVRKGIHEYKCNHGNATRGISNARARWRHKNCCNHALTPHGTWAILRLQAWTCTRHAGHKEETQPLKYTIWNLDNLVPFKPEYFQGRQFPKLFGKLFYLVSEHRHQKQPKSCKSCQCLPVRACLARLRLHARSYLYGFLP